MKIVAFIPVSNNVELSKRGLSHILKRGLPHILSDERALEVIEGKIVLKHVVDRLRRAKMINEIIVLTSDKEYDKTILEEGLKGGLNIIPCQVREDLYFWLLWDWYLQANTSVKSDIIVCSSADGVLADPFLIDVVINDHILKKADFTYPLQSLHPGMVGVFNIWDPKALKKLFDKYGDLRPSWDEIEHEGLIKLNRFWPNDDLIQNENMFYAIEYGKKLKFSTLSVYGKKNLEIVKKIYSQLYREGEIVETIKAIKMLNEDLLWMYPLPTQLEIEIEVTNDCNLKCIMCPRTEKMSRETGYMEFDLFKKIVDETETFSIHFSGFGEPLIHPQIREMFAYAKENGGGLEVGLWTNGLNLDEELSREIIEKELLGYIIFGLDAVTKATYAKIKGVDVYDKVVENINRFLELKKEILKDASKYYGSRKPLVGVQIVKMKENDAEIEEFMNKWDYMDKTKKMINYRNRSQELSKIKNEDEKQEAFQKLSEELMETFYTKAELPVEHAIIGHFNRYCNQIEDRSVIDVTPLKRFPCKQLRSGLSILWNGDVVICRQDFNGKYVLGNIGEKDLEDIWKDKNRLLIEEAHFSGEYSKYFLCSECMEWYYL